LALTASGTNLFAGTNGGGVFLSTNKGTSWTQVNSGLANTSVTALAICDNTLFAATFNGGIFLSSNNGANWTKSNVGLTTDYTNALLVNGKDIFLATMAGIFRSTNYGASWTRASSGLTHTYVFSFAASGTNIFAGTGNGIHLSTNSGASWTQINSGLTRADLANNTTYSLAANNGYLFAGTFSAGVWRRAISEVVSVGHLRSSLPDHFSLEQNYPNPFNPRTTIEFSIPVAEYVTLNVYDLQGRKVATLISSGLPAGTYRIPLNVNNLSAGVYMYRMHAGAFTASRKVILLK
jgi:photosystem II stability/assembly factor-like uncharacterized protein